MSSDAWVSYIQRRVPHLVHILDRHGLVALLAQVLSTELHTIAALQDDVGFSPTPDFSANFSGDVPELSGTMPTPDVLEMHILCLQQGIEHVVLEDGTSLVGDLSPPTGGSHVE